MTQTGYSAPAAAANSLWLRGLQVLNFSRQNRSNVEIVLKSALIALAMLFPASIAFAQTANPTRPPAPAQASKPAKKLLEINQIVGLEQVDATTFNVSARLEDGSSVDLQMNAFVMQDLAKRLGTFGR